MTQLSHCWSRFSINPFFKLWNNRSTRHLPHEGNSDSTIQEIFACTFWNRENFCLYNPESRKFLLVQSVIQKIFACTIRNRKIFAFIIRNRDSFCLYNPQSRKFLLVQSMHNFCLWGPESWVWESGIRSSRNVESGIQSRPTSFCREHRIT